MKRFVMFLIHEYMDEFPEKHIRMMEGESEDSIRETAVAFAEHMNRNYSGGTTTYIGLMTAQEAKSHIESLIDDPKYGRCSDEEEVKFWEMYEECYGTK